MSDMGGVDATAETVSEAETIMPTSAQLAEARDRAQKIGMTVRGRKKFSLGDGPRMEFAALLGAIALAEAMERGDPTYMMLPCGSGGTVFMNDKEQTSFFVERQEDGELTIGDDRYKKTWGSKTDLVTGETIQFDVLENGSHKETRRFPKEDDEADDETRTEIAPPLTDLAARIQDEHQAAASALRQGVLHAIAAGELLLEAKAQLKHGGWLDWLKANCEIPERTVQAYMRLARLPVEKRNAVADLPLREALSAIRSRQERLERAEEAENRPPPGPARICTVGPDGEVLFGKAALAAIPQDSTPARQATEDEIADELMQQLGWALLSAPPISVKALRAAFDRRFPVETDEERATGHDN
jgi:hypothetical protein